jgi:hypothetical protein
MEHALQLKRILMEMEFIKMRKFKQAKVLKEKKQVCLITRGNYK